MQISLNFWKGFVTESRKVNGNSQFVKQNKKRCSLHDVLILLQLQLYPTALKLQFKWRAARKLYMFHVLLIYSMHIAFLHITQTHFFVLLVTTFLHLICEIYAFLWFFLHLFWFVFQRTTNKLFWSLFCVSRFGVLKFKPYGASEIKAKLVVL